MERSADFLYLSNEVLEGLDVSTAESVESIEQLLHRRARSQAWSAPVTLLFVPDGRIMLATLAAADDPPLLAVKSQAFNPRNSDRGLAPANGVVTLLNSETGLPVAVLDVNWVTGIRTAGLSAVAAKRLARADSSVIAFIGCGVQAHSHLRAFGDLFPLEEVRAFGRGSAKRDTLCEAAQEKGYTAVASATGQEAIEGADIVVTSVTFTPNLEPFLDARGMKPGAFAAITDLAIPWVKEGMPAFDRIIVDDVEQEASTSYPMVDPALIRGDLLGVATGDTAGRENDEERTAFVFSGLALGDLALAGVAYRKARAASRGAAIG